VVNEAFRPAQTSVVVDRQVARNPLLLLHSTVIAQCKKRNRTKKQRLRNDKPTHKTAHLQAPPHKPKLRLAKELFSCQRSDCSTDRNIV